MLSVAKKELTVADHCHAGAFEMAAERLDGWRGIGVKPHRNGLSDLGYAETLQWAAVISVELSLARQIAIGDSARDMLTESALLSGAQEPLVWLGVCYQRCGEYNEAEAVLLTCLSHDLPPATRFLALRNLAVVKTYQSQLDQALDLLAQAEAVIEFAPTIGRGKLFLQRGLINRKQNDLDTAIVNYERAAEYFEEAGNPNYQGAVSLNLARVFALKGEYLRAHVYAESAVSTFELLQDKLAQAKAWDEIARIYLAEQRFDKAERAACRAVSIIEKGEQGHVLAECLITHGQILSQRALTEAVLSLTKAANICAMLGDSQQKQNADQCLIEIVKSAKQITASVSSAVRPIEHRLIKESLLRNKGVVTRVSSELGIPKETIFKKIRTQFPDLLDDRRPIIKRKSRRARTPSTNSSNSQ